VIFAFLSLHPLTLIIHERKDDDSVDER
jgi:hypothetical protein